MRKTLCAVLAAASMVVACSSKDDKPKQESVTGYVRKDLLLPYQNGGIRQLWFERSANGSFKPYIEVKADFQSGLTTTGCLYTEGNESLCAGKPNPTLITDLDFYYLVGHEDGPVDDGLVHLVKGMDGGRLK